MKTFILIASVLVLVVLVALIVVAYNCFEDDDKDQFWYDSNL